ncbi:MAG: helix-turn-helix domain-containing protein [Liquorilactobacillus sp.]|uniref:helix-turn-helix domain-containing protein n=1 Tax=Liquorilactobacillus sp. TaxID=2767923 RepID=UPI0039E75F84
MKKIKKFYNPELETTENYTEVWKPEVIEVKDEADLLVLNHYWQDKHGDLWGDFDDPMENVRRGFDAYRKRKGYMTPDDIRNLRNQLNMSVRDFANAIGIGFSSLTQIENNQRVQVRYQDILFRLVKENYEYQKKIPDILQELPEQPLLNKLDSSSYISDDISYTTSPIYKDNLFFYNKLGDVA